MKRNRAQFNRWIAHGGFWLTASVALTAVADPAVYDAEIVQAWQTFDARQGVAVDADHFYAINNYSLTRHDKRTGAPQLQWDGNSDVEGPLIHLDGGFVMDGKLYAAHSNYPIWPMTSSLEIWDTRTLEHIDSISFGIHRGSLTWVDHHDGHWWAAFGNYDRVQAGQDHPYGETRNTQVVKLDAEFQVLEAWTLPEALHPRLTPMSNSGGSWGPDGLLYLTGHDHPEIYVMRLPQSGSVLDWVATVHVPGLNGQGLAWDRSLPAGEPPRLWAIHKERETVFVIAMPTITPPPPRSGTLRGPDEFATDR